MSKGFHVVVSSWENDADYRQTNTVRVDSLKDAQYLLEWLEMFRSSSSATKKLALGNTADHDTIDYVKVVEYTNELRSKYEMPSVKLEYPAGETLDDDYLQDLAGDWLREEAYDYLGSSEFYTFRVFDGAKVVFIPEDIEYLHLPPKED